MLRNRPLTILAALLVAAAAFGVWKSVRSPSALAANPEKHPQTTWGACNRNARNGRSSTFRPLSDAAAARLVSKEPETRRYNSKPYRLNGHSYPSLNAYVPSKAQVRRFRRAKLSNGQSMVQFNPYFKYVDGRDGLRKPTTDEIIQWAAHKWGIPENWLRAEYVQESYWNGFMLGDEATVSRQAYARYPSQARVPGSLRVYESMGITQIKWLADGSLSAGTNPLRWESTAFNIDYQAAMVRFYYDNPSGARSAWGDRSYTPCEAWRSIGGWYEPYPWGNAGQADYIRLVQQHLAAREWASSSFVGWRPTAFPPGIRFR